MSLVIWTKASQSEVYSVLYPALKTPDFKIQVCNDFSEIPKGKLVLALGSECVAAMAQYGITSQDGKTAKKNATLTSFRNQVWTCDEQPMLISYSPGVYGTDYSMYIDMLCDVRTAIRIALTGSYEPIMGNYEYVNDFGAMIADIEDMYVANGCKPVSCAHDTETLGSDPWRKIQKIYREETKGRGKNKTTVKWVEEIPAARFITWQWSHRPGYSAVKYFASQEDFEQALDSNLYEQIEWLFHTDKIAHRLANGKYDLVWHMVHTRKKGQKTPLRMKNFKLDTTLVGSCLDENRSNSLDVHAKIYTNLGGYSDKFDREANKSRMDLEYLKDPEAFLKYSGGDTDATLQVAEAMKGELVKQPTLGKFYINCLHPAARAFEIIEHGGVFVNREKALELDARVTESLINLTNQAKELIGGRLVARHKDESKIGGLNITKPSLLKEFLFDPNYGLGLKPTMWTEGTEKLPLPEREPSTSLDHLLNFKDHPEAGPFVRLLEEYSSAAKTKSTYVDGFFEHLRSDGRFHPSYFLHKGKGDFDSKKDKKGGTVTGRLSAKDPPFQTVPKHTKWAKLIRAMFCAPPGYLVLERDYSQGELRVVACIANELAMIDAYQRGLDLHVKTGGEIAGLTYEQMMLLKKSLLEEEQKKFAEYRQQAKPANFGLLYGQQAEGFIEFAWLNYGVSFSLEQGRQIREAFFRAYPRLLDYHEKMKTAAHKDLQVVSPLGRIRHLPLINSRHYGTRTGEERKAINSPVQSTLSDMMIWALGIEAAEGLMDIAPCFGVVHDAGYDYVPEDKVGEIVKRKKEIMENLPFEKVGWKPQLHFPADCKVGPDMANLKDFEFAKAA